MQNLTDHDATTATSPARVLVIDDEPQIRRFLDISLRAQGYQVLQAATGEEGLTALALQGADLVILDIGLRPYAMRSEGNAQVTGAGDHADGARRRSGEGGGAGRRRQ